MKRTRARKGGRGLIPLAALAAVALIPLALPAPSSADPLRQGVTTLVSTFPDGTPADGAFPSVSKDGRYVAFESFEPLTEDDTDSFEDVFRKDMQTGEILLVSPNFSGVPFAQDNSHPSISEDGNEVAYLSGICFSPEFSLAGCSGLYAHVRDVAQGTTTLASSPEFRVESAQLSRDGKWTVLADEIDGWYGVAAVENATGKYTRLVPIICGGCVAFPLVAVSGTGRFVAFESVGQHVPGDLDGNSDVYRLDRDPDANGVFDEPGKSAFVLASILPAPVGGHPYGVDPAISEDGNVVGFNGAPWFGSFAAGFETYARDISSGITTVVSANSLGVAGSVGAGRVMSLSAEGRYVAFASLAPHMALGDTNPQFDVFLRDRQQGKTYLVSILPDGTQGVGDRIDPSISSDGRFVAFQAALIGRNRLDRNRRVYLRDRQPPCSIACLLEP